MSDLTDRVKTDLRLPRKLVDHVAAVAQQVGLPKNAFFAVAAAKLASEFSTRYVEGKKRKTLLKELRRDVDKAFDAAMEKA